MTILDQAKEFIEERQLPDSPHDYRDFAEQVSTQRAFTITRLEQEIKRLERLQAKHDMWLRIAQRLFKERQTLLHGHTYKLPSDDVILEALMLDILNK